MNEVVRKSDYPHEQADQEYDERISAEILRGGPLFSERACVKTSPYRRENYKPSEKCDGGQRNSLGKLGQFRIIGPVAAPSGPRDVISR
jgi:hypothetical protein